MKKLLLAATAVLGLSVTAYAGEGNGEPFPAPDTGVVTSVQNPKYTMGADAPFNYFAPGGSTSLSHYVQAPGASQDPFPYKTSGRVIQMQPAAPTAIVKIPSTKSANHG
jgi:hypothetical protein